MLLGLFPPKDVGHVYMQDGPKQAIITSLTN